MVVFACQKSVDPLVVAALLLFLSCSGDSEYRDGAQGLYTELYTIQWTVYTEYCKVYNIQSLFYTEQCIFYIK